MIKIPSSRYQVLLSLILLLVVISFSYGQRQSDNEELLDLKASIDSLRNENERITKQIRNVLVNTNDQVDSAFVKGQIERVEQKYRPEIDRIDSGVRSNQKEIASAKQTSNRKTENINKSLSALSAHVDRTDKVLMATRDSLGMQVMGLSDSIADAREDAKSDIVGVNANIQNRSNILYAAAAVLVILIVGIYFLVRHRVKSQEKSIIDKIEQTRQTLQEQTLKVDADLVELLEARISLAKESPEEMSSDNHKLPLKLADEIHKMRRRLRIMDENQGVKVLARRIESLEDTLIDMGYETKELEGTQYHDGMHIEARFITDESIKGGDRIINKVLRPQVNYNGKMIQSAEVEVSQGE